MERYTEVCGDNRFELIAKYKQKLIEATNIETAKDEMSVIDSVLFRFWQMGWLDKLEEVELDEIAYKSLNELYDNDTKELSDNIERLRAEVEGLKKENEILSSTNKTLALSKRKIEAELTKAKQEVAREIFEDIEQEAYKNEEGDLYLDLPDYLKVKNKYTGETK